MESQLKNTAVVTFKAPLSHKFDSALDELLLKSRKAVKRMLENRDQTSSKLYKEIPCVVAKGLISKYQKNKKLKKIKSLVILICGDKGKQVKLVDGGLRIPSVFKKAVIPARFPRPVSGFIRCIELFKRDKSWFISYTYNTPVVDSSVIQGQYVGVDRNSVGNVAVISYPKGNKAVCLGPDSAGLSKNFRNRRAKLQAKGAKLALKKIKQKQSNRTKQINHQVSKSIVNFAKLHRSAIVLENLSGISKGKAKKYVQKSQWSFFQLELFIKYKAALLSIPVVYINPAYTSQICSQCGTINKPNGKSYKCSSCGHVAHRDVNAALNIRDAAIKQGEGLHKPTSRPIDGPLNR